MIIPTGGFYPCISGTAQFGVNPNQSPKEWTIEQKYKYHPITGEPLNEKNVGITIYFTCDVGGHMANAPSSENPVWVITVDHEDNKGGSTFKLDALRGSTLGIPAKRVKLSATVEGAGPVGALVAPQVARFYNFGFTAIDGCFQRSAPNYTFLKDTPLTVSGGATPNTGLLVIPPNTRALLPMSDTQAVLANLRVEVFDLAGATVILQQLASGVRFGIPGNAGFVRLSNTSAVTAQRVSCMAESSF